MGYRKVTVWYWHIPKAYLVLLARVPTQALCIWGGGVLAQCVHVYLATVFPCDVVMYTK